MDEGLVFHNPRKGSCPIYVQDDVSARLINPTKDYIKNFGGIVTDNPQKAIIVVVVNSRTHLGSKLITDYAGEGSGKGVVDQAWVLESVRQGRMLGPPDWGGYVLHRHTVESFFELAENTPGIVSASSSVTVDARGRRSTSEGQAPLQSPEPSGYTPTNRSSARASVPRPLAKQRAVFSQRSSLRPTSSPHPRPSIPRPSKARNAPSVAKGVRTKTPTRRDEAHLPSQVEANTTPQLPTAEDSIFMSNCGRFKFTEIERAYVRAQFEQARATGPLVLTKLSAAIAEVMPWHSRASVDSFIRKQQWFKELVAIGNPGAGKGQSRTKTTSANNSKAKEKKNSPTLSEGYTQSSSEGSDDTGPPSEPDSRSTSEPPPAAPPMPKTPSTAGRPFYTETEKKFVIEYLAWGERNDITPKSALYASLNELMPWRTEQSIRKFVSNHPEHFGKRNIPPRSTRRPLSRAGLENRLQQSQQKNPASPAEVRQSEDVEPQSSITSAIDEGLASSPDDHRPQATAPSAKGKAPSILSEAVTEAMVLALKDHPESHWASDNRQKRARLWKDFSKTHPNHSAESYYQYHVEHHEQLESAARELAEDGGHTDEPFKRPGPRVRNDLNPAIDSLIKEGKLEDPVIPPLSPSGSYYDQKDCLAVIQYLADNPSLFYGPIEVPRGASSRLALWAKFEAKYKTRTAIAWAEFHRAHHSTLEKAARKLISIRQEREHDDPWHESSSSSTVYGNAESQPSARGSSVLGFILQIPNLLKRSVQDDAESSSPSKRVKFEDS